VRQEKVPFTEAQEEIRQALQKQQKSDAIRKYVEKLRAGTYVWTIFDSPAERRPTISPATAR